MKKIASNNEIVDFIIEKTVCDNDNQLAEYLTARYGVNISRQQINQFRKSNKMTITHLLLREALADI